MEMKGTGIIMSGNHPRLILNGSKSQTRRVVTKANSIIGESGDWSKLDFNGQAVYRDTPLTFDLKWLEIHRRAPLPWTDGKPETGQYLHVPYNWAEDMAIFRVYPKWEVSDRLWVREGFYTESGDIWYKADGQTAPMPIKWSPSIFMPRWASRILLEIIGIKVERIDQISYEDAKAEGCISISDFAILWDSLNGKKYPWANNPWCWCISFKMAKQ